MKQPNKPIAGSRSQREPLNAEALAAIWVGMSHFVQNTERQLSAQLKSRGLNAGQLELLLQIGAAEGSTQDELAAGLCCTKANISQLLDKMTAAGLVERIPDGRAHLIHLTGAGRMLRGQVMPEQLAILTEQLGSLTPSELESLAELSTKLGN